MGIKYLLSKRQVRENIMTKSILYGVILLVCFTAAQAKYCYYNNYKDVIYCLTGCCGTDVYRYCCYDYPKYSTVAPIGSLYYRGPNIGLIIGAVVGSVIFLLIVASIIVAVCCCCKKTSIQPGQIHQTTIPMAVYSSQVPPPGYGQAAYENGAVSAQILTANVQPGTAQRWEAGTTVNEQTLPAYNNTYAEKAFN